MRGNLFLLDYKRQRRKRCIRAVFQSKRLESFHDEFLDVIEGGIAVMPRPQRSFLQGGFQNAHPALNVHTTAGAYGVHVEGGRMRLYNFSIQTTDRYEPMEKLAVVIDGQRYTFGEVERTVGYDKFGYLMYSGLDPESTEVEPHPWDLDYRHSPIATVPAWQGNKEIELEFVDAVSGQRRYIET